MKYPQNIIEVGRLLPDYMGFIFWEKSIRYFNNILPQLPNSIKKTGVFVRATLKEIKTKVFQHELKAVQLHGDESASFCLQLKQLLPDLEIIKVFSIQNTFDFKSLKSFETACTHFLFDTKGKLPGGNGHTFDWRILEKYPSTKPFFLSGGIGIKELSSIEILLKTHLPIYGIDLNSKLETEPGLKDITICKEVIQYSNNNYTTDRK